MAGSSNTSQLWSGVWFDTQDVDTPTTLRVRERLESGRGSVVVGAAGSGKSHAVQRAVNGAVWVELQRGSAQWPRFFVDLAQQVEAGDSLLQDLAKGEPDAVFKRTERALEARSLVVDRCELLVESPGWGWDDPTVGLWQQEQAKLASWLASRVESSPVVLVGRRPPRGTVDPWRHEVPDPWPIKLGYAEGGKLDWPSLAGRLGNRPGGLVLARTLLQLLGVSSFDDLLWEVQEAGHPGGAVAALARLLRENMPRSWVRALTLVEALSGVPGDWLREPRFEAVSTEVAALKTRGLVVERSSGRLSVLPLLHTYDAIPAAGREETETLLRSATHFLLASVNDRESLRPVTAERVLRAHQLYLRLGDFENARRTARFHLGGLLELARRISVDGNYAQAHAWYSKLHDLSDESDPRMRSYVRHYWAYNGDRSGDLTKDTVLDAYREAAELWEDNALWHQRLASALIELGRQVDAEDCIRRAYELVQPHPRRDLFLRLRPAGVAMQKGQAAFALKLIDPLGPVSANADPDDTAVHEHILRRWQDGVSLEALQLQDDPVFILFKRPQRAEMRALAEGFWCHLASVAASGRGKTPASALDELTRSLGGTIRRLISTPTHQLEPDDLDRKGRVIGLVDLLNSDVGLAHAEQRWLLGRVKGAKFISIRRHLDPITLAVAPPNTTVSDGLYFGRVSIFRDGYPCGEIDKLEPVGRGRSAQELMSELRKLEERDDAS